MKKWALFMGIALCFGCSPGGESGSTTGGGGGTQTQNPPASITITAQPTKVSLHGGTSNISVTVLDENNNPVAVGTVVQFSISPSGMGTISPAQATTNQNGVATATFSSGDTPGDITITATVDNLSASTTITILPPHLSSIRFVSAEPSVISLQGSGGITVSKVTFEVRDSGGNPVEGIQVSFDLYGPGGGEFLDPATSSTDANGKVYTYLNSGRLAGPVRIIAWTLDPNTNQVISAASNPISIGGGKPSHLHLSLSAEKLNVSGLKYYGIQNRITAFVADRFGNIITSPVMVSFFTEGGAIETGTVNTQMGQASVILQTQGPPPRDVPPLPNSEDAFYLLYSPPFYYQTCETQYGEGTRYIQTHNPRDGLVTIIAVTKGEETFFDANGNGVYDPGEDFIDIGEPFIDANDNGIWDDDEPYTDADGNGVFTPPEPYDDTNENCQYDPGEPFTDLNGNGTYDTGDPFTDLNGNGKWDPHEFYFDANGNGKYDGPNGVWDDDISIWQEIKVVFSGGIYYSVYALTNICDLDCYSNCTSETIPCGGNLIISDSKCGIIQSVVGILSDVNGNPPPFIIGYKIGNATLAENIECEMGPGCLVFETLDYSGYTSVDQYPGSISFYSEPVSISAIPKYEISVKLGYDDNFSKTLKWSQSQEWTCNLYVTHE